MIYGICDEINGNVWRLRMTNSCKISKINGNISDSLQMLTDNCYISEINGNIKGLKKTHESTISKINGRIGGSVKGTEYGIYLICSGGIDRC